MSLRHRAAPAALLLCLAGCSDPAAPVESGAFWLLEVGDTAFSDGAGTPSLSAPDSPRREGKPSWIAPGYLDHFLLRTRRGGGDRIRESGRFDVPQGKDVVVGVDDAFELRLRAVSAAGGDGRRVEYRFAWHGVPAVEGSIEFETGGAMCFVRAKGGLRYDLVMCAVKELRR